MLWEAEVKFVLSFSGGKDSIHALHTLVRQGHEPVALLVMTNRQHERSWTHGMDMELLQDVAAALEIPLLCCSSTAEHYERSMEQGLRRAKELGAAACAFGDIDIQAHREWDEARCSAAGLEALLPLWGGDRYELSRHVVELGYTCLVKSVRKGVLPESFLGQALSLELLEEMRSRGVDPCGENGEYHTVAVNGPLFRRPVRVENKGKISMRLITAADLTVCYRK
ncbi:MAG: diphthine--ammonia ligase [Candidatus Heteroscillospira sp.]|jgi:diphthine-ammonia ligase